MDNACSGKQTCDYVAVGTDLGQTAPCSGLHTYLEVDYTCVKGKQFRLFIIGVWLKEEKNAFV